MRRWSLIAAWFLVLVLATGLTWQIVSAADDRVSDRPPPLNIGAPDLGTTEPADTSFPTFPEPLPTTTGGDRTDTTVTSPPTTTSSSGGDAGTTTTTTTTTPAPTTTAEAGWSVRSVETDGGTVVLKYRPGEVVHQTSTPATGFQAEVEKPGPPIVEVEFESETRKIEVKAEWADDDLRVEVSEHEEG